MQFKITITPLLATLLLGSTSLVSATRMAVFAADSCAGNAVVFSGHSDKCTTLNNVKSVKLNSIDDGCTGTYYSDDNCSHDANLLHVGNQACDGFSNSGAVRSFSWDCSS